MTKEPSEFIKRYSVLPSVFQNMLIKALTIVKDESERQVICELACAVSNKAWQDWIADRKPEDNRKEHEWIVFLNLMRIAESEGLSLSEKRIATAFAFTHDSYFIKRIMEATIEKIKEDAKRLLEIDPVQTQQLMTKAEMLEKDKADQRNQHMIKGAENARILLYGLFGFENNRELMTNQEIDRCCEIIRNHDKWKTGEPYPLGNDTLAVACVEADALWPMHPLGVLADIERPDENEEAPDTDDPNSWRQKVDESLGTLLRYQKNWDGLGESFQDADSIFRTSEGFRIFNQWRGFWGI